MKQHDARDQQLLAQRLAELGDASFESIEVKPFAIERNGVTFGLIIQEPEEEDEPWSVIAEPGNYMAFFPPWKGDYDTEVDHPFRSRLTNLSSLTRVLPNKPLKQTAAPRRRPPPPPPLARGEMPQGSVIAICDRLVW